METHVETHDWLATHFEARRPHLRAVAYRMLGSLAEAEDAQAGVLASPEPRRYQRRRESGWMADHGRCTGLPERARRAQITTRGISGSVRAPADHEP